MKNMAGNKFNFEFSEEELQTIMDSLSNTVFNEEIKEDARKNAKELFLKLQKNLSSFK